MLTEVVNHLTSQTLMENEYMQNIFMTYSLTSTKFIQCVNALQTILLLHIIFHLL
jgi:hypothetical protein